VASVVFDSLIPLCLVHCVVLGVCIGYTCGGSVDPRIMTYESILLCSILEYQQVMLKPLQIRLSDDDTEMFFPIFQSYISRMREKRRPSPALILSYSCRRTTPVVVSHVSWSRQQVHITGRSSQQINFRPLNLHYADII